MVHYRFVINLQKTTYLLQKLALTVQNTEPAPLKVPYIFALFPVSLASVVLLQNTEGSVYQLMKATGMFPTATLKG